MPQAEKKKILLAEDDDSMRRFIVVVLKKASYEVVAVEDGLKALTVAMEDEIDAVIADALMPNFSGYELCRVIRNDPGKKHIPLIIISGFERRKKERPETSIADLFLTKDAELKQNLLSGLASLLDQAEAT